MQLQFSPYLTPTMLVGTWAHFTTHKCLTGNTKWYIGGQHYWALQLKSVTISYNSLKMWVTAGELKSNLTCWRYFIANSQLQADIQKRQCIWIVIKNMQKVGYDQSINQTLIITSNFDIEVPPKQTTSKRKSWNLFFPSSSKLQ